MQTIQFKINSEEHKKEIALHLCDFSKLTSGIAFPEENAALIFLDTNILLWLYRVNKEARAEMFSLLNTIKSEQRLWIPSWVIHEYNHHIMKRSDAVFFPFKKSAKEIQSRLKIVEKHSKLVIDDDYLIGTIYEGKTDFLDELEKTAKSLESLLKALTSSRNEKIDEIQGQIESLIEGCILESDLNKIMHKSSTLSNVRLKSRVPPGFLDKGNPENEHGDYIFWQEIIHACKEKGRSAILITNDKKPDWVYTPRMLLEVSGNTKPNNGSSGIKIDLPLPFLQSEFKSEVGKDLNFMLCNIELISHLCSSVSFNPEGYKEYGQLAKAVSVESQKDDTYLVISWFLNNQEKYNFCIKTVARWESSPQQIDDEALREYIGTNVPNIDINQINMSEIICELFI